MVEMPVADRAVHDLIRGTVLKPRVIERALDRALDLLEPDEGAPDMRADLRRRLIAVETELANLTETAAEGGAVPIILEALTSGTKIGAGSWPTSRRSRERRGRLDRRAARHETS